MPWGWMILGAWVGMMTFALVMVLLVISRTTSREESMRRAAEIDRQCEQFDQEELPKLSVEKIRVVRFVRSS